MSSSAARAARSRAAPLPGAPAVRVRGLRRGGPRRRGLRCRGPRCRGLRSSSTHTWLRAVQSSGNTFFVARFSSQVTPAEPPVPVLAPIARRVATRWSLRQRQTSSATSVRTSPRRCRSSWASGSSYREVQTASTSGRARTAGRGRGPGPPAAPAGRGGQQAQDLVVQAGLLEGLLQLRVDARGAAVRDEHGGRLLAEQELHPAVHRRLEAGALTEGGAVGVELARGELGERAPGGVEGLQFAEGSFQRIHRDGDAVLAEGLRGRLPFVDDDREPQLHDLGRHQEDHLARVVRAQVLEVGEDVRLDVVLVRGRAVEVEVRGVRTGSGGIKGVRHRCLLDTCFRVAVRSFRWVSGAPVPCPHHRTGSRAPSNRV